MQPIVNTSAKTQAPSDSQPSGASPDDPILTQIIQQTEAKVKTLSPQLQAAYHLIVVPGMKILYTPQTHQHESDGIEKITGPQDVPAAVAQGVTKIIVQIYHDSQGKMTFAIASAAAVTLACYIMGDIEKIKGIPMTSPLVAQTNSLVVKQLYAAFHVSPQQVQQAIDAGKAKQGQGAKPTAPPAQQPTPPPGPASMQGGA